jgi:hypothetical protein
MYTSGSLLAAAAFAAGATAAGEDTVAILGGAFWVFVLSMIILMSTVTPVLTERLRPGTYEPPTHH